MYTLQTAAPVAERLLQPTATVVAAFIAAAAAFMAAGVGAWYGARTALGRFKRERAFDRRLDWHERMARMLAQTKLDLEIAKSIHEDPSEPDHSRGTAWGKVQSSYLHLTLLEAESKLYATPDVVDEMRRVLVRFDEVSDGTNGFDVPVLMRRGEVSFPLMDVVEHAIWAQAIALRAQLDFEPLGIPSESRDAHEHAATLLVLRAGHPALRTGSLVTLYIDYFIYAYLREFQGDVVLVAINNGALPMPDPLTIDIGANSNVPPRVTALIEGRTLTSHTPGVAALPVTQGRVAVQLPGKTAGVYSL